MIRRFVGDSQADNEPTQRDLPRDTPLVAPACSHAPLPEVALEFLNGPSQSMIRPVRRVMSLIGSASGCKFRLTDASVSRFHGSLLRTSAGLWIVDLLGQSGIAVNEVPVRFSRLADGDILRIGRYQIRVRLGSGVKNSGNGLSDLGRSVACPQVAASGPCPKRAQVARLGRGGTPFEPEPAGRKGPSLPADPGDSSFPKVDLMPLDATLPVNLAQSELTESMLVPLVNQFGLMQQQMFDQFQQAMAMMVQMFGTMHRDQMEVIRAELDQLRELTEEFHALKNELANRSRAETATSELAVDPAELEPTTAIKPEVSVTTPVAATFEPSNGLGVAPVGPSPVISPSLRTSSTPRQQQSLEPRLFPTPPLLGPPVTSPTSEQRQEPGLCSPAKPNGAGLAANSERDTVVWLHQRIMSLQRERESRWQKILKLLPGMS